MSAEPRKLGLVPSYSSLTCGSPGPRLGKQNRGRDYCAEQRQKDLTRQASFLSCSYRREQRVDESTPGVQVKHIKGRSSPSLTTGSTTAFLSLWQPPPPSQLLDPSRSSLSPSLVQPTVSYPLWDCVPSVPRSGLAAAKA